MRASNFALRLQPSLLEELSGSSPAPDSPAYTGAFVPRGEMSV